MYRNSRTRKFLSCLTACLVSAMVAACGAATGTAVTGDRLPEQARPGVLLSAEDQVKESSITNEDLADSQTPERQEKTKEPEEVTILAVGDNLIHTSVYEDAETAEGYDFHPMYQYVKGQISRADIATVNQETPLAESVYAVSGYPAFNSPDAAGDALIDTGFDVINLANNHMLDKGTKGALATLAYWEEKGIPAVGFYASEEDADRIRIIEKNGIKVAFLGYTQISNSRMPSGTDCVMIFTSQENRIREQIRKARQQADLVVVHTHWGTENTFRVDASVRVLAQKMVDWGADIIIGNHPHVLQELTVLTRESDGTRCPVIYSLGNFISAQKIGSNLLSGMLTVKAVRDPATGRVRPAAMCLDPIVTYYEKGRQGFRIYPLEDFTEEMAADHGVHEFDSMSMEKLRQIVEDAVPVRYLNTMGELEEPE